MIRLIDRVVGDDRGIEAVHLDPIPGAGTVNHVIREGDAARIGPQEGGRADLLARPARAVDEGIGVDRHRAERVGVVPELDAEPMDDVNGVALDETIGGVSIERGPGAGLARIVFGVGPIIVKIVV